MKALAEKLAKLFLVLLFLIGIEGIDVHAAVSYPNMLPDAETVGCEIKSGEIAKLKFTVVKGTSYRQQNNKGSRVTGSGHRKYYKSNGRMGYK